MSRFLYGLGRAAAGHPWRTLAAWVVIVAALAGLAASVGGTPHDDWDIPNARAQRGIELLRAHDPGAGDASARVVVHDEEGDRLPAADLEALGADLMAMPHVVGVAAPRFSADGDTAILTVSYDVPVTDTDLMGDLAPLTEAVADTRAAGYTVELGGDLPETATSEISGRGELIGVAVALLILVLLFGSVVAAGLPIGVALLGLAAGSSGITLLAALTDVSTTAPTVASMVGLGVGIDYALLLVTREVEYLREGHDLPHAAGLAAATAGRSVVFAGTTVLVSLLGLRLAGLPTFSSFGWATGLTVVAVMAAALTLVPAFSRLAGRRLLPRAVRRQRPERVREPLTARWAARVGRRPLPFALGAVVLLVALAAPTLTMRTWPQDASSQPDSLTTRRAYDLTAAEFGAGANGPLLVVVDRATAGPGASGRAAAVLADEPGIRTVAPARPSADGALDVIVAEPAFGPTDPRSGRLVSDLRADLPPGVEVTGTTPLFADIADLLSTRLWLVIGFVVAVSVLLLGLVFRSVVVPLKAAVMNLLSIGAAYGVMQAVFGWGWGGALLGVDHSLPISSWIPILMFTILFGLSMDYEVFLLSRVREDWLATGDAAGSVRRGLSATGRVISAAAAIMVAVFIGFATEADIVVKQIGVGMAVAIALDATVVRLVLVPATMSMLGRLNWWMPAWLDRLLPTLDTEGRDLAPTPVATPWLDDPDETPDAVPAGV